MAQPNHSPDEATGTESLYGFSSAVCAVIDEGDDVNARDLDRYDLFGEEDDSVRALMYDKPAAGHRSGVYDRHCGRAGSGRVG